MVCQGGWAWKVLENVSPSIIGHRENRQDLPNTCYLPTLSLPPGAGWGLPFVLCHPSGRRPQTNLGIISLRSVYPKRKALIINKPHGGIWGERALPETAFCLQRHQNPWGQGVCVEHSVLARLSFLPHLRIRGVREKHLQAFCVLVVPSLAARIYCPTDTFPPPLLHPLHSAFWCGVCCKLCVSPEKRPAAGGGGHIPAPEPLAFIKPVICSKPPSPALIGLSSYTPSSQADRPLSAAMTGATPRIHFPWQHIAVSRCLRTPPSPRPLKTSSTVRGAVTAGNKHLFSKLA